MHILMITQWFEPEPTFKGLLFAKELQNRGHQVTVLTGFPNYPGGDLYEGYRIKLLQRETIDGVDVVRVPLYPSHDQSGIHRAANYMSFALSATIGAIFLPRPDVAYVYHPPASVGMPAIVLKALKKVPFVYDVQDLWPDTLAATGMLTNTRYLSVVGTVMKYIYRSASRIAVLSPGFRQVLRERSVPERKISVIPNWADESQMNFEVHDDSLAERLGFQNQFTVTFAGNIGKAQGLELLLKAAELLKDQPSFRFLVVGSGVEKLALETEAKQRNLPNLHFLERQPIDQIGQILSLSQALLVHLRKDPLFEITIPSKTQAYLLAGKPILMGVPGNASETIAAARAGITFESENAIELVTAIKRLMNMDEHERANMGSLGKKYYHQALSLQKGADSFVALMERACSDKFQSARLKRLLDMSLSAFAIIVLCLPMAAIGLILRLKHGSPVLFRQVRPGRLGEPFEMYKFRTMNDGEDLSGRTLPDGERLTRIGAILRKTSLDELPSLWNVLRGDMSLVGPRPLLMRYTKYFTHEESLRLVVKPGVTGWAQIHGRNTASWDSRLEMDVWYVHHASVWLDVKILAITAYRVFRRNGIIVDPESIMKNLDDQRRSESI